MCEYVLSMYMYLHIHIYIYGYLCIHTSIDVRIYNTCTDIRILYIHMHMSFSSPFIFINGLKACPLFFILLLILARKRGELSTKSVQRGQGRREVCVKKYVFIYKHNLS